MNLYKYLLIAVPFFILSSCGLLEDTDLDPVYFLECEVDGEFFRAQTANETSLGWFAEVGEQYTITGQDIVTDFNVSLTLFGSLGEGKIPTGTQVNHLLTTIAYFTDGKTFVSSEGSGCVNVELLTDDNSEGTFEGTLTNIDDNAETVEITNGKYKVTSQ